MEEAWGLASSASPACWASHLQSRSPVCLRRDPVHSETTVLLRHCCAACFHIHEACSCSHSSTVCCSFQEACSHLFSYFIFTEAQESKTNDLFLHGNADMSGNWNESLHFLLHGPVYVHLHATGIDPHWNMSKNANRLPSQVLFPKHLAFT